MCSSSAVACIKVFQVDAYSTVYCSSARPRFTVYTLLGAHCRRKYKITVKLMMVTCDIYPEIKVTR